MRAERQQEKGKGKRGMSARWVLMGFAIVFGVWAFVFYLNIVMEQQMAKIAWSKKKLMLPSSLVLGLSKQMKKFSLKPQMDDIAVMRRLL